MKFEQEPTDPTVVRVDFTSKHPESGWVTDEVLTASRRARVLGENVIPHFVDRPDDPDDIVA